ncbi:MAG TPA: class I tRNA ligase family protein, partial [Solirubrobacteraceae bacterium]
AAIMELTNECNRLRDAVSPGTIRFAASTAVSVLFPFAPHTAADAYDILNARRVWEEPWTVADPAYLAREEFELVCQVNGRVRDRVMARSNASDAELEALCLAAPNVGAHIDGKDVAKVVVVAGKLVNVVVR